LIGINLKPRHRFDELPVLYRSLQIPRFLQGPAKPSTPFRGPITVNLRPGRRTSSYASDLSSTLILWIGIAIALTVSWFVA
jgi:hypothetical protein